MRLYCRKCLPTGFGDIARTMDEYIKSLDEHLKADSVTYRKRLAICSECEKLIDGTCRECGCFVSVRAAKINMHCPDTIKKW